VSGGSDGRIRIETGADGFLFSGQVVGNFSRTTLVPHPRILPNAADLYWVRVTSVNGVAVPANPTGSTAPADVVLDAAQAVTLQIAAHNVPVGTVVKLALFNETTGVSAVDSTALDGTLDSSTATASVTFPSGFTRVFPSATWQ
jgi:hypothetical protein